MKTSLVISLLFLCSTAWACDSYESCMEQKEWYTPINSPLGVIPATIEITPLWASQKAIAYKLGEISKKLDKKPPINSMEPDSTLYTK